MWEVGTCRVLSVRAPFRGEAKFRSVTINSGSQFIGSMTSLSYYWIQHNIAHNDLERW